MRTFICVEFPGEVIKEVARLQEMISKKKFTGKLTELENLHLTLKFLGEMDEEKIERVKEALKKIEFSRMDLHLGRAGTFSYGGNPRLVWVKIEGKPLWELQKKVDEVLEPLFKKEERFMAHATIARIKYVNDKGGFSEFISKLSVRKIKFKINKFALRSSDLKPLGPVYNTLEEYHFKE